MASTYFNRVFLLYIRRMSTTPFQHILDSIRKFASDLLLALKAGTTRPNLCLLLMQRPVVVPSWTVHHVRALPECCSPRRHFALPQHSRCTPSGYCMRLRL